MAPRAKDAELKLLSLCWADAGAANVKGLRALVQQPVVVDVCALSNDNFRDSVGEIARALRASVCFHDREIGVAASDDERARVAGVALVAIEVREAAVVDVDGQRLMGTVGDSHHGYVAQERGVQGGKAVVVHRRQAAEVLPYLVLVPIKHRKRRDRREAQINLFVLRVPCGQERIGEADARDGGDGSVLPALVATTRGGKPEIAEALPAGGAQVGQPRRAGSGGGEGKVVFAIAVVAD